ncbi:MAG: hypothetical protein KIT17_28025, partial [Rubrivivax sp.]|nr:hypothetical protein [Rubrivivax sp.]
AVLLLARPQPARLLVVALVHPPGGSAAAWHRQAALDDELGRFGCATLNRLARSVWAAPSANHLPDADLFALDLFERLWQQGIAPVVRELAAAGVTALDLVPSGDLHLAPWGHLAVAVASAPSERSAQAAQPAASDTSPTWATSAGSPASAPGTVELRVLPSVGAWWACEREAGAPAVPTPRWALLAQPAPPELGALRWADVEARLSLALWGEAGMSGVELEDGGPAPPEADAALLIGHGVVPGSNAAQAGLATGARLVQPYQLLRLGRCRRALVSACLLGHTDDRSGEALGFLSGCFDHRLTFTAGWLTEVPDQAACLYSLAAQWLLRQSAAGAGRGHAAWAASLAQLRRELQCGAWPAGFGEWLAARWPRDAMEPAPPSPPAALLRALPWAVALG